MPAVRPAPTPRPALTRASARAADRARGNTAVALPGTVIFLGVCAYFAMLQSDERVREQERRAAAEAHGAAAGREE